MLVLHVFGPSMGLPEPSPFVLKAMMLLKFAGLSYAEERADVRKAPKQKLPVLVDGPDRIADSTFIRFHIEKKYNFDFDSELTDAQRGQAWAIEKMLEDHLYWALMHERWIVDENFFNGPAHFFDKIPALIRPLAIGKVRKAQRKKLMAHGMGRHTRAELVQLACRDIDAVAAILGDKAFIFGERPCGADAALFAFMWGLLNRRFTTPIRDHAESKTNIVAYVDRMKAKYFSA